MAAGKIIVERIASLAGRVTFESGADAVPQGVQRRVLEILHHAGLPAYVELGERGVIARLLVPAIARVVQLTPLPDGDLEILLERSAAKHWLRRAAPDFAALSAALTALQASGAQALVSENDAHEVVDVRPFGHRPIAPRPERRALAARAGAPTKTVSMDQARALFDMVAMTTCDPLDAEAPCIPFLYPDDGCPARAHEMCRRFVEKGVEPEKIWTWGYVTVPTPNHPDCETFWIYHVAPTLDVDGTLHVIDPSLCTAPVIVDDWLAKMRGGSKVALYYTPWTEYMRGGPDDPDFESTDIELARCRALLMLRSAERGPPPYAKCEGVAV